jgi:Fe-S-cluster-containing hydrogenase component 2
MSMEIEQELCTACADCKPVCPSGAISATGGSVTITQEICTECEGDFDEPQCVAVCPTVGAILPR